MEKPEVVQTNTRLNREEIRTGEAALRSKPTRFNIDLTGLCNLKCLFCHQKSGGYQYKPLDLSYLSAYESFTAVCEKIIDCSFGEPLTHPNFLHIAARFAGNGQEFGFSTNGLLLTPKLQEFLLPYGKQLTINFSVNAAREDTYFKLTGRRLAPLLENIRSYTNEFRKRIPDVVPPVEASFIVMKLNCGEVLDFLKHSRSLGVPKVNLRHLFEVASDVPPRNDFGYCFDYKQEVLPLQEYRRIGIAAKELSRTLGLELVIHWETGCSIIGRYSEPGIEIPCLFPWKFLFVQGHTQNVYACCYASAAVGTVAQHSLEETWNGPVLLEMRESLARGEVPRFCLMHGSACPLVLAQKQEITDSISREQS